MAKPRDQESHALDEIDQLHKACHLREEKIKELNQRIESLQKEISWHIAAAKKWEARFDRLLRIWAGESTQAAKWSDISAKIPKWTE